MADSPQNWTDLMFAPGARQQEVRTTLQQQEASYSDQLSGQTDAPYIHTAENFESWSHERLYSAAQSMQPGTIYELAHQWGKVQTAVMSDLLGFHGTATALISEHWEGDAADAASAAVTSFARSGTEFTTSLHASVGRLEQVASAAQEVKVGIQPPLPPTMTALPVAPKASELAAEAERQAAVRVMQAIYTPTYVQAGTNVPTLPPPRDVVNGGLGVAGPALGGGSPGASGGGPVDLDHLQPQGSVGGAPRGAQGSADPASPGSQDASTAGSPASNASLDNSGLSGQSPDGSAGQSTGGWSPADTSSASAAPLDSLSPASTGTGFGGDAGTGAGGTFGGGGGYGSVGSGMGTGFGGGSLGSIGGLVAPGPGGDAMAGRSAPVAGAGPSSTVATGAAGRPTTRGSMSGLARGAQHAGEDDEEYRPASYLVSIDNGNELVGELPLVVPPVIGATED